MQPGLLYPEENQQLPTCDPIMPTSPMDLLFTVFVVWSWRRRIQKVETKTMFRWTIKPIE